ncbi:DNA mismatch repair protein Pms1p [[Candida] railenensis]|uniref:DNA mismatch repair protein Pms1p n=1 Tax=[Candida] railenensis TaxID=45579 RepID=A0A9P0QR30_9ASCO|nr:DNA mismatch repair protein Pms1p [[Candida] railenensis]
MIQNISSVDIHRITSGQVITDLVSVTKELVENSIDANSSQIEITFYNYGIDSIQIVDNGDGIAQEDFDKICLKHNTSKLSSFENIVKTKTLGFRGEAMSSLCAVSEVSLSTCTAETYPRAYQLEFNSMGELIKNTPQSGKKGTSITISNLFNNLPVRKKDFEKNFKREFNKTVTNLTNYAIIYPQIRFVVFNVSGKNHKKNLILSTQGGERNTVTKNMVSIFGINGNSGLVPFEIETPDIQMKFKLKSSGELPTTGVMKLKFVGVISNSSFGMGRSSTDRQFFFINNRPVTLKGFGKCINEVYRAFNSVQYPTVVFNLIINNEFLDINVTPDKRTVMVHNEETVIEVLKEVLTAFFSEQGNVIPRNLREGIKLDSEPKKVVKQEAQQQKLELRTSNQDESSLAEDDSKDGHELISSDSELMNFEINDNFKITTYEPKRNVSEAIQRIDIDTDQRNELEEDKEEEEEQVDYEEEEEEETEHHDELDEEEGADEVKRSVDESKIVLKDEQKEYQIDESEYVQIQSSNTIQKKTGRDTIDHNSTETVTLFEPESSTEDEPLEIEVLEEGIKEAEDNMQLDNGELYNEDQDVEGFEKEMEGNPTDKHQENTQNTFDNNSVKRHFEEEPCCKAKAMKLNKQERPANKQRSSIHNYKSDLELKRSDLIKLKVVEASSFQQNRSSKSLNKKKIDDITKKTEAEDKLTLTVSKTDFLKMKVIGQFNLGFILVTRPPTSSQPFPDLFIIDQHASDEKFNFEKLQSTTVFQSQPLVIPQTIELTSMDELLVSDNIEIFKKNGFNIRFNEDDSPGERIKLISLPLSKQTIFDLSDFHEIIHLVKESDNVKSTVRCSKIRTMFASRACRSSIMIGQFLKKNTMEMVVRNLAGLDKPWNCPHGRPTMRHLMELKDWKSFDKDYRI